MKRCTMFICLKILLRCQFPVNLQLQCSANQHPEGFFEEIVKLALRYVQEYEEPRITETILKKIVGLMLPDLKTHYNATVIKTAWYQYKDKHIHQNYRIGSPEIDAHI